MILYDVDDRITYCLRIYELNDSLWSMIIELYIACDIDYKVTHCDFGNSYALVNDTPLHMYFNLDSKLYTA